MSNDERHTPRASKPFPAGGGTRRGAHPVGAPRRRRGSRPPTAGPRPSPRIASRRRPSAATRAGSLRSSTPGRRRARGEDAEAADRHPGADPRSALDLFRAARCISGTREREPDGGTGFGQVANGWNECPFSSRERILNALSRDESVRPDWIAALDGLPSSPYRTMTPVIADASGGCRHARGRMRSSRGRRLLQLIEMLDHAAVVV